MKNIQKSLVVAAVLATVGSAGLVGVKATHAVSDTRSSSDPRSSLVDKLASKFNLNKADVQKVFDENHTEMESKHQTNVSARLQKLVDAGTITATQKTKIEAKLKELQATREASRDSMKDLTNAERKAKMDAQKTALDTWAKDNGLDLTRLRGIFMGGGHRGFGGPSGPPPGDTTTN